MENGQLTIENGQWTMDNVRDQFSVVSNI